MDYKAYHYQSLSTKMIKPKSILGIVVYRPVAGLNQIS